MSSRQLFWSAAILIASAGPAAAQAPSPLDLVPGIREAGFPDLALEYLKEVEPRLSAAEKAMLPLERAKCLLESAEDEPDEGTRTSMVGEAKVAFDNFLATSANHPRASEASLALAYELQSRGALKVVAALSTDPATTPWVDARGLVVQLPADPKKRLAVFNLYAKQVRLYGFTPRADTGQKFLFIPAYRASGGGPD